MRKAHRIDANQNKVVEQLRKAGLSVAITSMVGNGFPDLVVSGSGRTAKAYSPVLLEKRTILIELKDPSKPRSARKLTPDERRFYDSWQGEIYVCTTAEEILNIFGIKQERK